MPTDVLPTAGLPITTQPRTARARRLPLLLALLLAVLAPVLITSATPASAAPTLGQKAVYEAARHRGQLYQYGAAGPTRFDCSGFTLYVYGRFGKRLPHSTNQQYAVTTHIAKASKAVGDLVFMRTSSGTLSHVGIYAGSNKWWVAPKTGDVVKLQTLYSSNYVVGRVR